MKRLKTFYIGLFCLLSIWACQDDNNPVIDFDQYPVAAAYPGEYYPMSDSSSWQYDDGAQVLSSYIIGYDSVLTNGITYKVLTSNVGEPDILLRNDGNNYHQLVNIAGAAADSTEITFLIDNQRINEEWEDVIPLLNGDMLIYRWSIDELSDNRRLNGNDLSDVIRVRQRNYFSSNGNEIFIGTSYYWYAKRVGLIERDEFDGFYRRIKGYYIR